MVRTKLVLRMACLGVLFAPCAGCMSDGMKTQKPNPLTAWMKPKLKIDSPPRSRSPTSSSTSVISQSNTRAGWSKPGVSRKPLRSIMPS